MTKTHSIEVAFFDETLDAAGIGAKFDIVEDLGINSIEKIRFSEIYYIEMPLGPDKIETIAQKVFLDPIVQAYSTTKPVIEDYNYYVEVKLHADVTDNLGTVAKEAIEDFLGKKIEGTVRSAKRYYISGKLGRETVEQIARQLFSNEIIENFTIDQKETGDELHG